MNKLIILRGCPGSGKSSWAKQYQQDYIKDNLHNEVYIYSADDYFIRPDRVYDWNRNLLSNAHNWCRKGVEQFMKDPISHGAYYQYNFIIILDNTNIKRKDFKVYIEMAQQYGFEVEEKILGEFTEEAIQLYAERNIHNVPVETIRRMAQSLEASLKNDG